jgi:cytoskeleton protein RodZ
MMVCGSDSLFSEGQALASFGERLKRTRENKKMSLDDVARATKINTRMLAALEEGKFDQLPGGVFNKGFVRTYARHLEINEEQAVRDYTAATGSVAVAVKSEDAELRAIADRKDKERAGRPRSQGIPWGLIAVFLLVLALGLSVWGFLTRERVNSEQAHVGLPRTSADDLHDQRHAGSSDSAATPLMPTEVAHTQTIADTTDDGAAGTPQPASSAPIVLVISAREDSWLAIVADGQPSFQDTLTAGRTQSISAQNEVVLKSGNIGGLDINFNGSKLPLQGGDSEVKTLTFTPTGFKDSSR